MLGRCDSLGRQINTNLVLLNGEAGLDILRLPFASYFAHGIGARRQWRFDLMTQCLRWTNTTSILLRVNTNKSLDLMAVSREGLSDLPVEFLGLSLKVLDMRVKFGVCMHDSPIL